MDKEFFDSFYAKSDGETTLEMHTRHVLTAAVNLLDRIPIVNEDKQFWRDKLHRMVVLHDLGKLHKFFVERLNGTSKISIRHELVSALLCINFIDLEIDELFAIATHHRGVVNTLSDTSGTLSPEQVGEFTEQWYDGDIGIFSKSLFNAWLAIFELSCEGLEDSPKKYFSKEFQKALNSRYQAKAIPDIPARRRMSLARALLMAADHLGSARKEESIPLYKMIEPSDFQPCRSARYLPFRPFQERLQTVKMDAILHAPTGSGKTEAAMSWIVANQTNNARVFYLLPYTASINAMVKRLQGFYGADLVTAVHSKTLDFFYDQAAEEMSNYERDHILLEKEARNKKSLSKELFYPIKVTTLHQILKTSLKGKGWEFSLLDYKNALFVIDEFHTYNALLTGMLLASVKLFKRMFNAKFLFLSATIPDFMLDLIIREAFDGDQSAVIRPDINVEADRMVLNRKRHLLLAQKNQKITDTLSLINRYLEEGRTVLMIVNNVKTAQLLYEKMGDFGVSTRMLHGGFNQRDRIKIEKEITHKNVSERPNLLIATQAVEVSLDIDYDVAFIENAPIDALIQRFGRVNRAGVKMIKPFSHETKQSHSTVPVYLFEISIGQTPFYNKEVLEHTWEQLVQKHGMEVGEDDLVAMCNSVYVNGYNETQKKDFENGLQNSTILSFEQNWVAGHWRSWVEDILEKNTQKIDVLCENLIDEYVSKKRQHRFIEANQLLVSVYGYEASTYKRKETGDVIIAQNLEYDSSVGYKNKSCSVDDQFW